MARPYSVLHSGSVLGPPRCTSCGASPLRRWPARRRAHRWHVQRDVPRGGEGATGAHADGAPVRAAGPAQCRAHHRRPRRQVLCPHWGAHLVPLKSFAGTPERVPLLGVVKFKQSGDTLCFCSLLVACDAARITLPDCQALSFGGQCLTITPSAMLISAVSDAHLKAHTKLCPSLQICRSTGRGPRRFACGRCWRGRWTTCGTEGHSDAPFCRMTTDRRGGADGVSHAGVADLHDGAPAAADGPH